MKTDLILLLIMLAVFAVVVVFVVVRVRAVIKANASALGIAKAGVSAAASMASSAASFAYDLATPGGDHDAVAAMKTLHKVLTARAENSAIGRLVNDWQSQYDQAAAVRLASVAKATDPKASPAPNSQSP